MVKRWTVNCLEHWARRGTEDLGMKICRNIVTRQKHASRYFNTSSKNKAEF